jgi:transposase
LFYAKNSRANLRRLDGFSDEASTGYSPTHRDLAVADHCAAIEEQRRRNGVERFFNKLKHFRAVSTRYDK